MYGGGMENNSQNDTIKKGGNTIKYTPLTLKADGTNINKNLIWQKK